MERAVLSWSGGKDAALALHELRERGVEVVELLTTVNDEFDRSTMHGVRRDLHEAQAATIGVPLNAVSLPSEPSNETYEEVMAAEVRGYRDRGLDRIVFADIHLEDVRSYREDRLEDTGVTGCWPLWGRDTSELVHEFLERGFRATVVAVDGSALDASFAGRELDAGFLDDLPEGVDPCGENGEFHTFVWDGPIFGRSLPIEPGETVTRPVQGTDFHYADLTTA